MKTTEDKNWLSNSLKHAKDAYQQQPVWAGGKMRWKVQTIERKNRLIRQLREENKKLKHQVKMMEKANEK